MADENLRVNMVINRFEHPQLYALLSENPMKARASLLRQAADFGVWARASGLKLTPLNTPMGTPTSIQAELDDTGAAEVMVDNKPSKPVSGVRSDDPHSLQKKGKSSDIVQPKGASHTLTATTVRAQTNEPERTVTGVASHAEDVLDTSVLSNFDLGELD